MRQDLQIVNWGKPWLCPHAKFKFAKINECYLKENHNPLYSAGKMCTKNKIQNKVPSESAIMDQQLLRPFVKTDISKPSTNINILVPWFTSVCSKMHTD